MRVNLKALEIGGSCYYDEGGCDEGDTWEHLLENRTEIALDLVLGCRLISARF